MGHSNRLMIGALLASILGLITACAKPASNSSIAGAPVLQTPAARTEAPSLVTFESCATREIQLTLNAHDASAKQDVLQVLRMLGQFPHLRLRAEMVPPTSNAATLIVRLSNSCRSVECARADGWDAFQASVASLGGVEIACGPGVEAAISDGADQCENPRQNPDVPKRLPKNAPARQEEPGVGGGNHPSGG